MQARHFLLQSFHMFSIVDTIVTVVVIEYNHKTCLLQFIAI